MPFRRTDVGVEQIEVFSIGTGNPPFSLSKKAALGGLIAWREAIKAAMFLTTDNATAQAKLLLGPKRCLRVEPQSDDAAIEMDDYDAACARLSVVAARDFNIHRDLIGRFFAEAVTPREHFIARTGLKLSSRHACEWTS